MAAADGAAPDPAAERLAAALACVTAESPGAWLAILRAYGGGLPRDVRFQRDAIRWGRATQAPGQVARDPRVYQRSWLTVPGARSPDGRDASGAVRYVETPAHLVTVAEALEILGDRGLWWAADDARAPRWQCATCEGKCTLGDMPGGFVRRCGACRDTSCRRCGGRGFTVEGDGADAWDARSVLCTGCNGRPSFGHTLAPRTLADLVACAGNPHMRAAVEHARTLAGDMLATIVLRVMSARELREHHGKHCVAWEVSLPLVFSREVTPTVTNLPDLVRPRWPVECPYSGGFGTPDDDRHGVHRAWPALRALAACQVHLLALSPGRVVLGVVAIAGEP